MGHSQFDDAIRERAAWNPGKKVGTKRVVAGPEIRTRAIVVQRKTARPVQFEITSDVRASLLSLGSNGVAARSRIMHFRVGSITRTT